MPCARLGAARSLPAGLLTLGLQRTSSLAHTDTWRLRVLAGAVPGASPARSLLLGGLMPAVLGGDSADTISDQMCSNPLAMCRRRQGSLQTPQTCADQWLGRRVWWLRWLAGIVAGPEHELKASAARCAAAVSRFRGSDTGTYRQGFNRV